MPSELGEGWNGTLCLVMNGARVQKDLKDLVLVAACVACVFSCFWVENSVQLRGNSFYTHEV